MQSTQRTLASLLGFIICAGLALSAVNQARAQDSKVNPTGTWTWTSPGRNGGPDRTNSLVLKLDGEKLTGTLTSPRRAETNGIAIADGKFAGADVSFKVTREMNGNSFTAKYSGKVSADAITGTIETERDGETQSRDWVAKRQVEKK
jgi:hypothetical protein